ncbi:hypothetical protein NC653_017732 [Populus alba x Populus x berolinensis]|uniref:Uncharacterized protein n=1 Tax=Populus alba x Populus x berolinensis TaxID=444605 RepID=A0AAD6QR01_9ROSI|nr:hypothetical protein NC653_017732 [Populus alba x Populus x berolinensis]
MISSICILPYKVNIAAPSKTYRSGFETLLLQISLCKIRFIISEDHNGIPYALHFWTREK